VNEPREILYKAAVEAMGPHGRALRERGWPVELHVDRNADDSMTVRLEMRVALAMPVPIEAEGRRPRA
jgi:hypothetical protein